MIVVLKTKKVNGIGNEYRKGEVPKADLYDIITNIHRLGPKYFGKSEVFSNRDEAINVWGHFSDVIDAGYVSYPK